MKNINLPLNKGIVEGLSAGDYVLLSGEILTGRDAAHKRIYDCLNNKQALPCNIQNETIYFVGPCFDNNGKAISAGPTTAVRMDKYSPTLMDNGILGMIGKGNRGQNVVDSIVKNGAVYFAAVGGAGAIYANAIKDSKIIAYSDLGTEAIHRFKIVDFPVIVAIDSKGNTIY
jgi:fumarate hydratase subunit beta